MQGKRITVEELQNSLNQRLTAFAGKKYVGTEFHSWYAREIGVEFEQRGITELRPTTWGIVAYFSEKGVCVSDKKIATVDVERNKDKRFTKGAERGIVASVEVRFAEELLPLTLEELHRHLLIKTRDEIVRRMTVTRDKAMWDLREAEANIERFKSIQF